MDEIGDRELIWFAEPPKCALGVRLLDRSANGVERRSMVPRFSSAALRVRRVEAKRQGHRVLG